MSQILCSCKSIFAANDYDGVWHCDGCGYPLKPTDFRYKHLKYMRVAPQVLWTVSVISETAMQHHVQQLRFHERIHRLASVNFYVGIIVSVVLSVSSLTSFLDIGSPKLHLTVLLACLPVVAALTGMTLYVYKKLKGPS